MELSEKELEIQASIRNKIESNIDFYVKNALTAEQTIALNKAKRGFYQNNKLLREIEAIESKIDARARGGSYAFANS